MSRVELKCRCGAEAVFDYECDVYLGYAVDAWHERHQGCPHAPIPTPTTTGETIVLTDPMVLPCWHEWEGFNTTGGIYCRLCGAKPLNVNDFTISGEPR